MRLIGPDEADRLVYTADGRASAQGQTVRLWADAARSAPADVQFEDGSAVPVIADPSSGVAPAAVVTVDAYSKIPRLRYPDGTPVGDHVIYCSVAGGPVVPLYASTDVRIDALVAQLDAALARLAALDGGTSTPGASGFTATGDPDIFTASGSAPGFSFDGDVLTVDFSIASGVSLAGDVMTATIGGTA